jgi:hypothetical protein
MSTDDVTTASLADTKLAVINDPLTPTVKDILAGNPVEYEGDTIDDVMQVFERAYFINHCGDSEVLHTCIYAMALQSCKNTKGLHAKANGKKGSGKSSAIAAALHLAPQESVCKGSFSDMVLFRKVMAIRHPRIMLDDVVLSEKQTANIKRASGAFQGKCEHATIIDNKETSFFIPERSVFFMTSVDEAGDDQLVDRFISLGTGINDTDDIAYSKWEDEKRRDGRPDLVVNDWVLLSRALLRLLATREFVVHTPPLDFAYSNDRRLINMVYDLTAAHAILYHTQRKNENTDGVTHVWADQADLDAIITMSMFARTDKAAETRFTQAEQRLHELIQQDMVGKNTQYAIYTEQELVALYGKTTNTLRALLYGRGGSQQNYHAGLMAKAPWMGFVEDVGKTSRYMGISVKKHVTNTFGQFATTDAIGNVADILPR